MRITIDTDKGIFIVPNTFEKTLEKQNEIFRIEKSDVRLQLEAWRREKGVH